MSVENSMYAYGHSGEDTSVGRDSHPGHCESCDGPKCDNCQQCHECSGQHCDDYDPPNEPSGPDTRDEDEGLC